MLLVFAGSRRTAASAAAPAAAAAAPAARSVEGGCYPEVAAAAAAVLGIAAARTRNPQPGTRGERSPQQYAHCEVATSPAPLLMLPVQSGTW